MGKGIEISKVLKTLLLFAEMDFPYCSIISRKLSISYMMSLRALNILIEQDIVERLNILEYRKLVGMHKRYDASRVYYQLTETGKTYLEHAQGVRSLL